MGIWKKTDETSLERELRFQRPQPRDEFVRMLGLRIQPIRHARRITLPKVALVAAVTTALAVSLGAAGALGAAGGSVHGFGLSVEHLVKAPKTSGVSQNTGTQPSPSNTTTPAHYPFQWQYGHQLSICWHGEIVQIPARELFWYLSHGARPPGLCLKWRPYPSHP